MSGPADAERSRVAEGDRPAPVAAGRNRGLDGVRGLAIALVLVSHAGVPLVRHGASVGLTLFFVLSGFLITSLLAREHARDGSVSLRSFYARRALRLLPALVVMVVVTFALNLVLGIAPRSAVLRGSLVSLLYVADLPGLAFPDRGLAFGRYLWSLSLEEQFYLLWPVGYLGFLRLRHRGEPVPRGGTRRDRQVMVVILLALVAVSLVTRFAGPIDTLTGFVRAYYWPWSAGFALLFGCAAALWVQDHDWRPGRPAALASLVVLGLVSTVVGLRSGLHEAPGATSLLIRLLVGPLTTLPAAVLVVAVAADPSVIKLLTHRIAVFLGQVSYGAYLWHAFAMDLVLHLTGAVDNTIRGQLAELVGAVLAVALGAASHRWVERPFMARKRRYERVTL